jgi:hypothetical protein
MERELIIERTRAGLEAARRQGRVGARRRRMTEQQGSGCKKAIGKRDTAIRGGTKLRCFRPHFVSLGSRLFNDLRWLYRWRAYGFLVDPSSAWRKPALKLPEARWRLILPKFLSAIIAWTAFG